MTKQFEGSYKALVIKARGESHQGCTDFDGTIDALFTGIAGSLNRFVTENVKVSVNVATRFFKAMLGPMVTDPPIMLKDEGKHLIFVGNKKLTLVETVSFLFFFYSSPEKLHTRFFYLT